MEPADACLGLREVAVRVAEHRADLRLRLVQLRHEPVDGVEERRALAQRILAQARGATAAVGVSFAASALAPWSTASRTAARRLSLVDVRGDGLPAGVRERRRWVIAGARRRERASRASAWAGRAARIWGAFASISRSRSNSSFTSSSPAWACRQPRTSSSSIRRCVGGVLRRGVVELLAQPERGGQVGLGVRDRGLERCDRVVAELRLGEAELLLAVADRVVGLDERLVREPLEIGGLHGREIVHRCAGRRPRLCAAPAAAGRCRP